MSARRVRGLIALAFFGAMLVASAPQSHADTGDSVNAQVTCVIIKNDPTPRGVINSVKNLILLGYDQDTAIGVFDAAIHVYCPEYLPLVSMTAGLIQNRTLV